MSNLEHIATIDYCYWRLGKLNEALCRVGQGHYCPFPPSEPYMKVSNHTAQAVLNFYLIETSS